MPDNPDPPSVDVPVPALSSITASGENITLTWVHPLQVEGSELWAEGYYVYRKTPGEDYEKVATLEGVHNTIYVDTDVTPGVTYTYTVAAYIGEDVSQRDETGLTATFLGYLLGEEYGIQEVQIKAGVDGYLEFPMSRLTFSSPVYFYVTMEDALPEECISEGVFDGRFTLYNEAYQLLCVSDTLSCDADTNVLKNVSPVNTSSFAAEFALGENVLLKVEASDGTILGEKWLPSDSFQRWSFENYELESTDLAKEICGELYGGPKTRWLTLNEHFCAALCSGMSLGVSAANAGALSVEEITGYELLNDITSKKTDSSLQRSVGYDSVQTVEGLLILFHLMQHQPATEREETENEWNFTGLMEAIDAYNSGEGWMPLVSMDFCSEGHTVSAYAYSIIGDALNIYIYDSNHPFVTNVINVSDYNGSSPSWFYDDFGMGEKGSENVISFTTPVLPSKFPTAAAAVSESADSYTLAVLSGSAMEALQGMEALEVIPLSSFCNGEGTGETEENPMCWISGGGVYTLDSLEGELHLADDYAAYSILTGTGAGFRLSAADGCTVQEIRAAGETVEVSCSYETEDGTTVEITFQGTPAEDDVTLSFDPEDQTVTIGGAEEGEITVTYDEDQTWTEPVHSDNKTVEVKADGETEPDVAVSGGVIRIAGETRIQTSLMLADQLKETLDVEKFETVIVAYAMNFPDALTGSYLAAVKDAPILLTYDKAQPDIIDYISENLTDGGTVYILGGSSAVSSSFETDLAAKGITSVRLAGSDRFGTNLAIMEEAGVSADQPVLIATAVNFADSLSASAAGLPMVLVHGSLRPDQKAFLKTTSRNFVIIGGTAAVSESLEKELKAIGSVERLAGASRYETSVLVAERFVRNPDAVILAYAKNFPDGLCGGPLAYVLGAPLILTDDGGSKAADAYVDGISTGIVAGGTILISDETVDLIFDK